MAKKKSTNKNAIIAICLAIVCALVIVGVIVAIVLTKPGGLMGGIDESYFVSDNTKYVIDLDGTESDIEEEAYIPVKSHLVYTYSDNTITGFKIYYEYDSDTAAKNALGYITEHNTEGVDNIETNGKYIIITISPSVYENMTAADVKQQVELIEALKQFKQQTENAQEGETTVEENVDTSAE